MGVVGGGLIAFMEISLLDAQHTLPVSAGRQLRARPSPSTPARAHWDWDQDRLPLHPGVCSAFVSCGRCLLCWPVLAPMLCALRPSLRLQLWGRPGAWGRGVAAWVHHGL